jgi:hypothetical protein
MIMIDQDNNRLVCANCAGVNLHHSYIVAFHRDGGEDAPRTLETHIDGRTAKCKIMPSAVSDNPSSRRDGIAIGFHCEDCGTHAELTIAQHKGQSLIEWRHPMRPYLSYGANDDVA